MSRTIATVAGLLLGSFLFVGLAVADVAGNDVQPPLTSAPDMGGCGGVYFLAEPGELVVEIEKRDRNRSSRPSQLRAILLGPDRRVIQEAVIPDDGQAGGGWGPRRSVRLSTRVERKGIYAVNVTVSQDRYGNEMVWSFRTNCRHYMIETARGHKDARHLEPIILHGPDREGDVCFLPRKGEFAIDLSSLPEGGETVSLFDASGALVQTLRAGSDGRVSATIPADDNRGSLPWRLHFPRQQATIEIDGLTRWERTDLCPDIACWTSNAESFFPWQTYRWLLAPYNQTVYSLPRQQGEIPFDAHNNSAERKTIGLSIEFPGEAWPAELSSDSVTLEGGATGRITVRYTAPSEGQTRRLHVRATPDEDPEFSTYSTLTVHGSTEGPAYPAGSPLTLTPYQHENQRFGYLPDYPTSSQVYFSPKNRPFIRTPGGVATADAAGTWRESSLGDSVTSQTASLDGASFGMPSTKIAFDASGGAYLIATSGRQAALLRSTDGGQTFTASLIPGREDSRRSFDIEQFSGHNRPQGPPPVVRYTHTASDPKLIWRRVNDLELFLPEIVDGQLRLGEPIMISPSCIGMSSHSGIPSAVVSRGDKVHVAWGEATDPADNVPGVPLYVVTYDRTTKTLGQATLIGHGPPANDIHNSPSITIDSQGYLHVLTGTHGRTFQYARSLEPNDAGAGWTEAVPVGDGLRQTYIGLVCGPDDTLHLVFRLWFTGVEPHPLSHHATLAYQRKPAGKPWEEPRVLVAAPFSEYSIFYHRLTIDRVGRLFLSYDYWSTHWFYRNDHRGDRRALIVSADGGGTWKLAETSDFQRERLVVP